jgi:hypothetical protein
VSAVPCALIYSPALGGHRQVYCREIADVMRRAGHDVVLAGAIGVLEEPRRAAFVEALRRGGEVTLVDTSAMPRGGRDATLAQLGRLVREHGAELTVLAEADDHLRLLTHQAVPGRRLPGRRVGLFLRSTRYAHVGRLRETLYERARRLRCGSGAWRGTETRTCSTSGCCPASGCSTPP